MHDLAAFYSIPYGAAPVGNMRWMPPVNATCLRAGMNDFYPAECAAGWAPQTLEVSQPGNMCMQMDEQLPCLTPRLQSEVCT